MGEHRISRPDNKQQVRAFMQAILDDIRALELMLERGLIEDGVRRVGVEQEMYLVDPGGLVAPVSKLMMEKLRDGHFQTELASFNLEANLEPMHLGGSFLRDLESGLNQVLNQARQVAETLGLDVVLVGVLPTLRREDVVTSNLTPELRYECLNDSCLAKQNRTIRLEIDGIERFESTFDSVVIEGANTSLQLHLQVNPQSASRLYNLVQLLTAPILAAAANSPVLLGRRLWHETRIAIFERVFDERSLAQRTRGVPTRVGFGSGWVRQSLVELFQENIARYSAIMTRCLPESSLQVLERGEIPELAALKLHNSTVWRWNRPCYGIIDGQPHLRIENRALPAGPTVLDEVANAALFYGTIEGLDSEYKEVSQRLSFSEAQVNFLAAAQQGLDANFTWLDGRRVGARELLLKELIPGARVGLKKLQVPSEDIARYLELLEARVSRGRTGARWLLDSLALVPQPPYWEMCKSAVETMLVKQRTGEPGHTWELLVPSSHQTKIPVCQTLAELMTTDVFTVHPDDVIDLATSLMDWQHIRHVPVEDEQGNLVGLLSSRQLLHLLEASRRNPGQPLAVKTFMERNPPTAPAEMSVVEAMSRLLATKSGCLLVVSNMQLLGLVTERDLLSVAVQLLNS